VRGAIFFGVQVEIEPVVADVFLQHRPNFLPVTKPVFLRFRIEEKGFELFDKVDRVSPEKPLGWYLVSRIRKGS
jgi:hypothetical protein